MTAIDSYPYIVLERLADELLSKKGRIGKKHGNGFTGVVVKSEPSLDDSSERSLDCAIGDTFACVEDEVGVSASQADVKCENVVTDLVAKIKKESEELVRCNDSTARRKQLSEQEVKCEKDIGDIRYLSHHKSIGICSGSDAFAVNGNDSETMNKVSGKVPGRSETRQINNHSSSFTKLFSVSVQLRDLFPSRLRKLGQAHINDKPCPCIYCKGEYRCSDTWAEFSKNRQDVNSSIPQNASPSSNTSDKTHRGALTLLASGKLEENSAKSSKSSPELNKRKRVRKIFECDECGSKFKTRQLWTHHLRVHTGEKPYECPHCHAKFSVIYNMHSHVKRVHNYERPFECKQCFAKFKQKSDLGYHMRVHSGEKPYQCPQCPKKFSQNANLHTHWRAIHGVAKSIPCPQCPATFKSKDGLNCHSRTHSVDRPFSCAECPMNFKSKHELKKHLMRTHSTEKALKCKQCPATFKHGSSLWTHVKVHHSSSKPFKCDQCDLTFKIRCHLSSHSRVHSEVRAFKCKQCPAAFKSKDELKTHTRIHTGEKPFECGECSLSFIQRTQLFKHLALHSGDRPFKCTQCTANFALLAHLQIHLRKAHNILEAKRPRHKAYMLQNKIKNHSKNMGTLIGNQED